MQDFRQCIFGLPTCKCCRRNERAQTARDDGGDASRFYEHAPILYRLLLLLSNRKDFRLRMYRINVQVILDYNLYHVDYDTPRYDHNSWTMYSIAVLIYIYIIEQKLIYR